MTVRAKSEGSPRAKGRLLKEEERLAIWRVVGQTIGYKEGDFYSACAKKGNELGRKLRRQSCNWEGLMAQILGPSDRRRLALQDYQAKVLREVIRDGLVQVWSAESVDEELLDLFIANPATVKLRPLSSPKLRVEEYPARSLVLADRDWRSQCYFGITLVHGRGSIAETNRILDDTAQLLAERPNDLFLRSLYTWIVLDRGSISRINDLLQQTVSYLSGMSSDLVEIDLAAWSDTVASINDGRATEPMLLRGHLEDALARAAFLLWLGGDGVSSSFARRIRKVAANGRLPVALRSELEKSMAAAEWLPSGIKAVNAWLNREPGSPLAYIFLLWLKGREGNHDLIPHVVDRALRWLVAHPNADDPLIRWAVIWLSGMSCHSIDSVVEQTRSWLTTEAASDDRLVRGAYLWLVGTHGSEAHVKRTLSDVRVWFRDPKFSDNSCLRICLIVWLAQRAHRRGANFLSAARYNAIIADNRDWANSSKDPLMPLALALA